MVYLRLTLVKNCLFRKPIEKYLLDNHINVKYKMLKIKYLSKPTITVSGSSRIK